MDLLQEQLFSLQDPVYRQMQCRIIPNLSADTIIGVRTPALRRLASGMKDAEAFLSELPHAYFEENQIHAFVLERIRDYDEAVSKINHFLPYVDNWATCDQLRPKVFSAHREELITIIPEWLSSDHPYTVRFGIGMLMCHYLDKDFRPEYLQWVCQIRREEYYVQMMAAWYFATALAKQYDATLPYILEKKLPVWVHNKTIQKATESYRIAPRQKELLKQYRIR